MLSPMPVFSQKDLESISLIRTGSGFALKAFHPSQNIDVAVKFLTSQNVPERDFKALLQEVSGTRHLQCDKLLPPAGICKLEGLLGVTTKWMQNGSLHALIHEHDLYPELPFCLCVRILSDVAEGLAYLHSLGPPVLHHCLKPSNILLDLEYRAKISDYGLATYRKEQLRSLLQTNNNRSCWDLLYLSPEILQGGPFSQEGDVYSFGMVCWEILSRQKPLQDKKNFLEAVSGICSGIRPGIEPEFIPNGLPHRNQFLRLILLCWHQEAHYRPRVAECRTFLRNILGAFQKEMILDAIYNLIHAKDCAVAAGKGPISHGLETGCHNLEIACPQNNNRPNKEIILTAQSLSSIQLQRDPGRSEKHPKQTVVANDAPHKTPLEKVPDVQQQTLTCLQKELNNINPCGQHQENWQEDTLKNPCCKEKSCVVLISEREAILNCMTEGRLNHILDVLLSRQLLSRVDYEAITSCSTLTGRSRALLDTCVGLGGKTAQTVVAVLSASKCSPLLRHQ